MGGIVFASSVIVSTWCVLVATWLWRLINTIWWRPLKLEKYLKQQGINGRPYELLYGDTKELASSLARAQSRPMHLTHQILPRVTPFIDQTVKNYGELSVIWMGTTPRVNLMDPELVKEILSNKFGHFAKPKSNPLTKFLATGVANYDGEKWAKHRRLLNPAFHQEKLKCMLPAFFTSCSELITKWEKMADLKGSCEVDVWPELQNLTGDVISRTAFGSSYKEGTRIFQLQTEQAELVMKAARTVYIPGFRFLPTKDNIRRKEIDKEVQALLRGLIKKRQKALQMGNTKYDDLLGLMMESNLKSSQGKGNSKSMAMTIEDVIAECKLFYFAGQETTSVLLTWTMVALSMNPSWQERAREEVMLVFGTNKPEFDGLNHLRIVTMILYEVLRLYPPIVLLVRQTYKEIKVGEFTFPPGVQLSLPTLLIHHDQKIWGEDAEEFKPERFSEGVSKASNHQLSFFPFGWGPRICIGQNFALLEAKLALAMILQCFSFELSPSYAHAPYTVITLQPQYGAQIILHKL